VTVSTVALRRWGEAPGDVEHDAAALAAAWADPEVARWTAVPEDRSVAAARRWIAGEPERRSRRLAVDLVVGGREVLGEVGLTRFDDAGRAELGFWLAPQARRRGLATAAVTEVTRWALTDLGLRKLWARTDPGNDRAAQVLVRAGFTRKGEAGPSVVWTADAASLRA
jgi:RimJ/RimL family protein N-acetyltransferase